jgi:hypothetical protein
MGISDTIISFLGVYNNLDEPKPLINNREVILGIVITFMVKLNLVSSAV